MKRLALALLLLLLTNAAAADVVKISVDDMIHPISDEYIGRAIDFMVSDSGLGQQVADWARAHAGELNLYDVIWQQHIWTPERSSEGWRSMPDRGSPTANHFDHVHISVN